MKTSKLVWTDTDSINQERGIYQKKVKYFNFLIEKYNEFQPFRRVLTLEDAIELLNAPVKTFDKAVISSSNMPTMGGLSADINAVCTIYNVDRNGFIQALNTKEKYSYSENDALDFDNGIFSVDEVRYLEACERFKIHAVTNTQIEYYDYWANLASILNLHYKKGFIQTNMLNEIAKGCGFIPGVISTDGQQFLLDEMYLANQILNLK